MAQDEVQALVVPQWMPEWDDVRFNESHHQARPDPHFYLLTLAAPVLRSLSGIHRRDASAGVARARDVGIQRRHDESRSSEIRRFVRGGFPWSTLAAAKRDDPSSRDLLKPGWLPTAVVVNIVRPGDVRDGQKLDRRDAFTLESDPSPTVGTMAQFRLPETWKDSGWEPSGAHPIEVVDGQHRLWAFEDGDEDARNFGLPVVAFYGLDVSWQAYLFWTINIKPKKINTSLAFDLYPLLREQDWLEAGEGLAVYRETRAQELTEALWSTPSSPWYQRINMLGEPGVSAIQPVTQAAFIRNIIAAFVKSWQSNRGPVGGLFGGSESGEGLPWTRTQQAAFLVFAWRTLADSIAATDADWAQGLRDTEGRTRDELALAPAGDDPAFSSRFSLLASDQGVRPILHIYNDLCYVRADVLRLRDWTSDDVESVTPESVERAVTDLGRRRVARFVRAISDALATYDWRNAKAPALSEDERAERLMFRGSGGYRELRRRLLRHLEAAADADVAAAASEVRERLKF